VSRRTGRYHECGFQLIKRRAEGKRAASAPATGFRIIGKEHQKIGPFDQPQGTTAERRPRAYPFGHHHRCEKSATADLGGPLLESAGNKGMLFGLRGERQRVPEPFVNTACTACQERKAEPREPCNQKRSGGRGHNPAPGACEQYRTVGHRKADPLFGVLGPDTAGHVKGNHDTLLG